VCFARVLWYFGLKGVREIKLLEEGLKPLTRGQRGESVRRIFSLKLAGTTELVVFPGANISLF